MAATARLLPTGWTTRSAGGVAVPVPPRLDLSLPLNRVVAVRARVPDRRAGDREAPDPTEPVIDLIGSAETADTYDTCFVQAGLDERRFRENPIFLRQHDSSELPIGRCEDWWREDIEVRIRGQRKRVTVPATVFRVRFDVADDPAQDDDWQKVARAYLERYRRGFLRGASIRFVVPPGGAQYGDEMDETERARYGISEWGIVFRKWELMELSAVTLPSNEHALARSDGSCIESDLTRLRSDVEALRRQVDELRSLAGTRPVEAPAAPERAAASAETEPTAASESPAGGATPPGSPSDDPLTEFARQVQTWSR
jgi:hypothetical protein